MEKMFVVRVVAVDELGVETPTTVPMKMEGAPDVAIIEQDLDKQYPHLKHRVVELEELKTPDQVDDWQHSFLGPVFGAEHIPHEHEE
jgi:hypothetical protein